MAESIQTMDAYEALQYKAETALNTGNENHDMLVKLRNVVVFAGIVLLSLCAMVGYSAMLSAGAYNACSVAMAAVDASPYGSRYHADRPILTQEEHTLIGLTCEPGVTGLIVWGAPTNLISGIVACDEVSGRYRVNPAAHVPVQQAWVILERPSSKSRASGL